MNYITKIELKKRKNHYPYSLSAFKNLKILDFKSNVTFFVGENGVGKSTLIEAIAINYGFNPEGGSKNFKFSTYDSHSELYNNLIISKGLKIPKDGFFFERKVFIM